MKTNKLYAKTVNNRTRVVRHARSGVAKPTRVFPGPLIRTFLSVMATLIAALPAFGIQEGVIGECLVRKRAESIIDIYERKLFVTPDEVARYVFLTNRRDDGDRSAAVYRAHRKKGSLPGAYWVTVTEAPDSLTAATRNMRVERHDAPVPASVADALHALWEAVLKHSPTDEHAIPCAPTALFSVRTISGARLSAVTVDLDQRCTALINVGESLVDYAKLPLSKRPQAAAEIEKQARRLLQRKR
jgi:hypothetical protein